MKTAVLFSGGKDSTLALHYALRSTQVKCLISVISSNPESFMFHTPNITLVEKQAEAIGLPLILQKTKGVKEEELKDLEKALRKAKKEFKIEGVFTGALASNYQASRIQKLCDSLGLNCINPLWQNDPEAHWGAILGEKFKVVIVGVSAHGLEKKWLGAEITGRNFQELKKISQKFSFNLAFEGGEAETFVIDGPIFNKRIKILKAEKLWFGSNGLYKIKSIKLVNK